MPMFDVQIEDSLKEFMDGLDALDKIIGKAASVSVDETPRQVSQRIDQQSASETIIRISGIAEERSMLKRLVDDVREIAKKYGGESSNFMSLLQTAESRDGIENLGPEGEYLDHVHLNFIFK